MAAFAPTRALGTSGYQLAIHRSHFRFYSLSKTQAGLPREEARRCTAKVVSICRAPNWDARVSLLGFHKKRLTLNGMQPMTRTSSPPAEEQHLQRNLTNRHIQLIAIGGAIGTGLFMGSGKTISLAGPSIIFVYMIIGFMLFFVMRAMGSRP